MLAVLAACSGSGEAKKRPDPESSSASGSAPAVRELPGVAPHSGQIERIAITDDGTVAYTIDTFSQGRLWLSLDGTREPIVARGGRAIRVALERTDDGFVAALLDEAGGLDLVRFDRDGRTRGHTSLAPDPGFVDVVAIAGGMLVRRRDQILVWYDAGGRAHGQLAPDPGERISAIAVRRGRAVAAVVRPESTSISLRWIELDRALAWGARQTLKADVEVPIALSPDGTKLAAIDRATKSFGIVDLATGDVIHAKGSDSVALADVPAIGFLDDKTAVFTDRNGTRWWSIANKDPWAVSQRGTPSDASDVAIGDGVMLDATSTSLTLTTQTTVRYLGYRDVGPTVMWPMQGGIATARSQAAVWLGRELHETARHGVPAAHITVVGDHHVVILEEERLYLLDAKTKDQVTIGTYSSGTATPFDAATKTLVVPTATGFDRFRISTSPLGATPLPALVAPTYGQVTLLDPATSSGVVAAITSHVDGELRVDWYREPKPTETVVKRSGSMMVTGVFLSLGADRNGVVYFVDRSKGDLVMIQADKPSRTVRIDDRIAAGVPMQDGSLVILATAAELIGVDVKSGAERWKLPVPEIDTLMLSIDGETLFASGPGGMVSLSPQNGTRFAIACGWSFGLHEEQVSAQVFRTPNLCAGIE